jgi:prophage regulatory protein
MPGCKSRIESKPMPRELGPRSGETEAFAPTMDRATWRSGPIRMLRLAQVVDLTGLGKTKIYELQSEGSFPMRVQITGHSVGWIESEVQAWLARRVAMSTSLVTRVSRKSAIKQQDPSGQISG